MRYFAISLLTCALAAPIGCIPDVMRNPRDSRPSYCQTNAERRAPTLDAYVRHDTCERDLSTDDEIARFYPVADEDHPDALQAALMVVQCTGEADCHPGADGYRPAVLGAMV